MSPEVVKHCSQQGMAQHAKISPVCRSAVVGAAQSDDAADLPVRRPSLQDTTGCNWGADVPGTLAGLGALAGTTFPVLCRIAVVVRKASQAHVCTHA